MTSLIWIILGMSIATFLPRLLPLITLETEDWPPFIKRMLTRVPFAVMGALIFPGILLINDTNYIGLIGGIAAFILAWVGVPLIGVVIGAILIVTGINIFI